MYERPYLTFDKEDQNDDFKAVNAKPGKMHQLKSPISRNFHKKHQSVDVQNFSPDYEIRNSVGVQPIN